MISLYETKDGSKTLLNVALNETYHSRFGAIQESMHVFIEAGLREFLRRNPEKKELHILEVGFGTGLNAILTLREAQECKIKIYYESIEVYPLTYKQVSALEYVVQLGGQDLQDNFRKMHTCPWDKEEHITDFFVLHKKEKSLLELDSDKIFQLVFFDAFAANVQPEMWTLEAIGKATQNLEKGGIFVTYAAKGQLKRDLRSLGFEIERIPGPPGKREMTRATKS